MLLDRQMSDKPKKMPIAASHLQKLCQLDDLQFFKFLRHWSTLSIYAQYNTKTGGSVIKKNIVKCYLNNKTQCLWQGKRPSEDWIAHKEASEFFTELIKRIPTLQNMFNEFIQIHKQQFEASGIECDGFSFVILAILTNNIQKNILFNIV